MKKAPQDPSPISQQQWQHSGALLRDRRNAAKLSRVALAQLAKVSDATIKFIETARHPPSRATLLRLLAVAELHLTWSNVPGQHDSPERIVPVPPTHSDPPSQTSPLQESIAPSPDPARFLMNLIGFDEIHLPPGTPKTLRIFQERQRLSAQTGDKNQPDGHKRK